MSNPYEIADYASSLFKGLSGFWQRFFRDTADLEAFYQASEQLLGQVYLDLLGSVLSTSVSTVPVFNKEVWKLFAISENDLSFQEGQSAVDDRFVYDMPGTAVDVDVLQNSIVLPIVLYEKDRDFDIVDTDGYLRFKEDPFKALEDSSGEYMPAEGVAWRWQTIQVGNAFYDANMSGRWQRQTEVRRGNTLRVLAHRGAEVFSSATGQLTYAGTLLFEDAGASFTSLNRGDVVEVYGDPGGTAFGRYVIQSILSPTQVVIDASAYLTPTVTTAANLSWRLVKSVYFDYGAKDYDIDFFEDYKFVGKRETPFPIDKDGPLLYAVLREPYDDTAVGVTVNSYPLVTDLGVKHLKVGSVDVYATRLFDGGQVQENVDYTVDYLRGIITPVQYPDPLALSGVADGNLVSVGTHATFTAGTAAFSTSYDVGGSIIISSGSNLGVYTIESVVNPTTVVLADSASVLTEAGVDWSRLRASNVPAWDPASTILTCSYKFYREVLWSANGFPVEQSQASVRQLSLWAPEVSVDRFTLYNNFGHLLNRFEASSETYRALLRGIMYLYVSGPMLQRVVAALNVATGLPVIGTDGEILTTYDDGLTYRGFADGELDATTDYFYSPSVTFTPADVGGYVIITKALSDMNESTFQVLGFVDSNTVVLESPFGFISEVGLDWEFSRDHKKTITTLSRTGLRRTYVYPYAIPMRDDLIPGLEFSAFEVLTRVFTVTDYLVDPTWWHNKYIPEILWGHTSQARRAATSALVAHTFDPMDEACVDDPGLYFDATEDGVVFTPTVPGSFPVEYTPLYRHTAAYVIFDRYLKMHVFYVGIDRSMRLSNELIEDISDLVLVAKPSYTYPYVEPGDAFEDFVALLEEFNISGINFTKSEDLAVVAKSLFFAHDILAFDDYYRYVTYTTEGTTETAPLAVGSTFSLPLPNPREYFVTLRLNAAISGVQVIEGLDYTVDLDPTSVTYGEVEILTAGWDAGAITFDAQTVILYNASLGVPDTTVGYTPLAVDGLDPTYLRDSAGEQTMVDRAIMVTIDANSPHGTPYVYV